MRRAIFLTAAGLLISTPAMAQESDPGAISRGLVYARQACSSCHAVDAGQRASPNPNAPTFESVANISGMTRMALNVWLHSPHPTMPQLIIDPYRIDDLTSYISTLKRAD